MVAKFFGFGILAWLLTGFVGCFIRVQQLHGDDSKFLPFNAFTHEGFAVGASVGLIAVIFSALKRFEAERLYKLNLEEAARKSEEAARNAEEAARRQREIAEIARREEQVAREAREKMRLIAEKWKSWDQAKERGNNALCMFEAMATNLNNAHLWLDQAESDFEEGAFAPFWDSWPASMNV